VGIIRKIFTTSGPVFFDSLSDLVYAVFGIVVLIAYDVKNEYFNDRWLILNTRYPLIRIAGIVSLIIVILLIGVFDGGQFIYFQF
jgi:alginate O-acetyltransferase complex protein AlgI